MPEKVRIARQYHFFRHFVVSHSLKTQNANGRINAENPVEVS
jgi:hypothetical protein